MNDFDFIVNDAVRLRIGYRSPGLRGCSASAKMELAARLGMSVIEPQIVSWEIDSADSARAYKEAADQTGIRIASIGTILPHFSNDDTFEAEVHRTIEIMRILGVGYCFAVVKNEHEPLRRAEAWELLVKRIQWVADLFAQHGYVYSIEVDKACFIETLANTKLLLEQVHRENVYINFDPANNFINQEDPLLVFETFESRIKSIHIKDAFREEKREAPVGEGELDYERIFRQLLKTGRSYHLFIEHCRSEEQVTAAANQIRQVLERLKREVS